MSDDIVHGSRKPTAGKHPVDDDPVFQKILRNTRDRRDNDYNYGASSGGDSDAD